MAAFDVIKTYSFTETLANEEVIAGTFAVDFNYASTTAVNPSNVTILNEHITATDPNTKNPGWWDTSFTSSTNVATSFSSSGGVETIGFQLKNTATDDTLNFTFTDSLAAGSGTLAAEFATGTYGADTITNKSSSEHAWDGGIMSGDSSYASGSIICYAKGTQISTGESSTAVEKLREGDLVLTLSGELEPVKWVGHRRVDSKRHPSQLDAQPVCIIKDAFGPNLPVRKLLVSPLHSIYVDGILVPAIDLVNGLSIYQEQHSKMTYFHVELASHNVVFAEGLPAETYLDDNNRDFFVSNDESVVQLDAPMPPLSSQEIWDERGFAKVVREGPQLDGIRAHLLERATQLLDTVEQKVA